MGCMEVSRIRFCYVCECLVEDAKPFFFVGKTRYVCPDCDPRDSVTSR